MKMQEYIKCFDNLWKKVILKDETIVEYLAVSSQAMPQKHKVTQRLIRWKQTSPLGSFGLSFSFGVIEVEKLCICTPNMLSDTHSHTVLFVCAWRLTVSPCFHCLCSARLSTSWLPTWLLAQSFSAATIYGGWSRTSARAEEVLTSNTHTHPKWLWIRFLSQVERSQGGRDKRKWWVCGSLKEN